MSPNPTVILGAEGASPETRGPSSESCGKLGAQ
jgi:hypothetical protein